jgi:endonuclease/exonuclease/phosphatase (EEP) superfamily protein YafD
MVAELSEVEGPMVMMGDFNTDWQTTDSSLKYLAEQMNLSVFKPHAGRAVDLRRQGRPSRLDPHF